MYAQFKIDYSKIDFNTDISYQKWTKDDGLPSNDIYDIVKSRNGFYYIGSSHGLVRFDGSDFRIYNTKTTDLIKANTIRSMMLDSSGKLWLSNGGNGVLIYDGDRFERLNEESGLSHNHTSSLAQDKIGKIFIGTHGGGLNIYHNKKFSVLNKKDGLATNSINSVLVDSKERVWIGSNSQDLLYMQRGKIFKFFDSTRKNFSRINCLFEDDNGIIWIGTDSGFIKIENDIAVRDDNLKTISDAYIKHITGDSEKNIWFATSKGVFIYDGYRLINFEMEKQLLPQQVSYILINQDGIWMTGPAVGLLRMTLNKVKVLSEPQGMPDKIVRSVYQDKTGTIWFGTNKGIASYDETSEKIVSNKNITPPLVPYAWTSNSKGEIFIGARNTGVWKFANGALTKLADKKILGVNFIRSLLYDDDNTLWIGTNGAGVAIFRNGKFKFINKSTGLKSDFVACIVKNKNGTFWIGTSGGGIALVDRSGKILKSITEKDGLASNIVTSIIEDYTGAVWISSGVFGLSRMRDGKIFNILEKDGIYTNSIKKMILDSSGRFWCTSEFGLFSLDMKILNDYADRKISKMTYNLYGKKDGMKSDEFHGLSDNAACLSKSGKLYFPSADGVVIINPNELLDDKEKPLVYIDDVLINNEVIKKEDKLSFSPGTESIQFNYGGISLNYGKNISYKYLLEGYQKEFIDAGKRRQAFYTHLPHGNYKFRVIAVSPNGYQSETEAAINFIIEPYIWQTFWFRIGILILIVASSALLVKSFYQRKYKRKMALLETESALDKERMRISKDMHDELGASLTRISLMTELAKRNINNPEILHKDLNNISDAGREVAITMDEIVWAVNPKNDNLDKMIGYITQYVEELLSNSSLNLKLEIVQDIPDIVVSAEIRHNVFLVIKEAFNNIIKHANATQAYFKVDFVSQTLSFTIRDNGKGLEYDKTNSFSDGLINMKKRIDDINGKIKINSEIGTGTEIIIKISFNEHESSS